jgi:hypothetical protein
VRRRPRSRSWDLTERAVTPGTGPTSSGEGNASVARDRRSSTARKAFMTADIRSVGRTKTQVTSMLCPDRSSTRRLCRVGWMGPRATARRSGRLTTQLYPISDFWVSATPPPPTRRPRSGKSGFCCRGWVHRGEHEDRWRTRYILSIAAPSPAVFPTFPTCGSLTEVFERDPAPDTRDRLFLHRPPKDTSRDGPFGALTLPAFSGSHS